MRVIDPGHHYELNHLDGPGSESLTFVKRSGPGYPGNSNSHPGTNIQEVLRVLIHRVAYLDNQIPCEENKLVLTHLRDSIRLLEERAAFRHHRSTDLFDYRNRSNNWIETLPTCHLCGHIDCHGSCK